MNKEQQEISEEAKKRAANYMSLKGASEPKDVVLGYKTSLDAQILDTHYVDFSNRNADKITSGVTNRPMETKKQTAVELFIEQLEQKSFQETEGINQIHITIDTNEYLTLKEQAKAMEKQQMRKTYSHGWTTRERFEDLVPDIIYPLGLDYEEKQEYAFEQYYSQIYGK